MSKMADEESSPNSPLLEAQVLSERANTAYDKLQNSGLFGAIRSAFK
jgi:hypothetical protein